MLDGQPIKIDGKEWIVPALNFKAIRKLRSQIEALAAMPLTASISDEQIDVVVEIIFTALTRNYPDLTKPEVEEMLTLANMKSIVSAIMGVSGFVSGGAEADGRIGT